MCPWRVMGVPASQKTSEFSISFQVGVLHLLGDSVRSPRLRVQSLDYLPTSDANYKSWLLFYIRVSWTSYKLGPLQPLPEALVI